MPDQKGDKPVRDKNQPFPKDEKKSSFGAKVAKLFFFFVFLLVVGSMAVYSKQIGVWPWAWTSDNWTGYLTFSQEKAKNVGDEIASYDWANLKTKVTDKTKQLWSEAPEVARRIEAKLGGGTSTTPAKPGQPPSPATATTPPADDVTPEHKLALESMRAGIGHYRKSPDDAAELTAAKKCFEEASGHFTNALKEPQSDKAKDDIKQELTDCNKYLEDCRAREKN